jgi:hypothetical protein
MLPTVVHIAPIRDEVESIVTPAIEHDADTVHLIADAHQGALEKAQTATGRLRQAQIEVESHPCEHTDLVAIMGLVTTLTAEYDQEDHVLVNTSTGGRTAAIGATLGCMDTDTPARAFRLTSDGDETPMSATEHGDLLPDCLIESPSWQEVSVLAIVHTEEVGYTRAKKRTVIDRMLRLTLDDGYDVRFGLIEGVLGRDWASRETGADREPTASAEQAVGDGGASIEEDGRSAAPERTPEPEGAVERFDDLDGKARKRAYARLGTILDTLESQGHVRAWDAGRSKELTITDAGEKLLHAFRHKAQPVIHYQSENGRAEVPGWLEQGFVESSH